MSTSAGDLSILRGAFTRGAVSPEYLGVRSSTLAAEPSVCPVFAALVAPLMDAGYQIDIGAIRETRRNIRLERIRAKAFAIAVARLACSPTSAMTLQALFAEASSRTDALSEDVREMLSLAIAGGTQVVAHAVGEIIVNHFGAGDDGQNVTEASVDGR
jgi:hypothetical protein